MKVIRLFASLLWGLAIASCSNSLDPDTRSVAGTYALESATTRGPATGRFVLTSNAQAERRVRYRQGDGTLLKEQVAVGTFSVGSKDALELSLREDGGASPYVWKVAATLTGGVLRIEYPNPADGPNIVELYRRQ